MKTKGDKKGKKRSLSKTSISTKPTQKQENVIEKSPKKIKLETSIQNGNSTTQNKVQILKKMYKQKEEQKTKQINIGHPLKAKIKTEETKLPKPKEESVSKKTKPRKENKLENLKKKQAKRELRKKRRRRLLNAASITLSIEEMEAKVKEIRNREVLSKRAKKFLTILNRKLKHEKSANNSEKLNVIEQKGNKKNKDEINALVKIKQEPNKNNEKIKVKKENVQHEDDEDNIKMKNVHNIRLYMKHNEHKIKDELEVDDSDDQDDNEDDEDDNDNDEDDNENDEDDNENDEDDNENDEDDNEDDENDSEDDEDDNEDDESDEDNEDDIDEKANILKGKKEDIKKMKIQAAQSLEHQKKNQYVLFVSNLPLKVKENELKQHFLTKVDTVTNVKIPTKPFTNLAYGFAFVELTNSTDFEKGLSMNHSFFKGTQIKVEVVKSNDKEMNTVKSHLMIKNEKPQAFKKAKKINLGQNQQKKKLLKDEK